MCGIFGYSGKGNTGQILLEGISKLDYRGYDSVGFATANKGSLLVQKAVGKIGQAMKILDLKKLKGCIGVAHTRWSTHGKVTEANAHPHLSCDKKIAIVHNGIVENYQELKDRLIQNGHTFASETDSEVIAHIIEEEMNQGKSFKDAVSATLPQLQGRFAIAAIAAGEQCMIGARSGSPLIVGVGEGEYFLSSDMQAFLAYTNQAIILNDNEIAVVGDGVIVEDFVTGAAKTPDVQQIDTTAMKAELGSFPHFMLKEIFEQPQALEKTIAYTVDRIKQLHLRPFNKAVIVACGTAYYAGLVGTYLFERFLRLSVDCQYASEFRYRNPVVDGKTLVIAISQSGETADTLAAVCEAKEKGAFILSICNVLHSTLARESHFVFHTQAGPEIGVASTKAFTSQLMVLLLMALYFSKKRSDYNRDQMIVHTHEAMAVPKILHEVLKGYGKISEVMGSYVRYNNFLFLGRGYLYPIALEGALKLKELSYVHAEGQSAAELKHGPIALIDKDMPSVFLVLKDQLYDKVLSNIQEVKSRGGRIIAIATEGDEKIASLADDIIYLPKMSDFISPIISVVPLQLMAYVVALRRGCDIDKPRNLAKVVTVE